jgi:hypothetical protein
MASHNLIWGTENNAVSLPWHHRVASSTDALLHDTRKTKWSSAGVKTYCLDFLYGSVDVILAVKFIIETSSSGQNSTAQSRSLQTLSSEVQFSSWVSIPASGSNGYTSEFYKIVLFIACSQSVQRVGYTG